MFSIVQPYLRSVFMVLFLLLVPFLVTACGSDEKDENELPTVALVFSDPVTGPLLEVVKSEMALAGYEDGQNINYEEIAIYVAGQEAQSLATLVDDVTLDEIDLWILSAGTFGSSVSNPLSQAQELAQEDKPIIVVIGSGNPVDAGYAEDNIIPVKNVTAILLPNADSRRFNIFAGAFTVTSPRIAVVYDSNNTQTGDELAQIEAIAEANEIGIHLIDTPTPVEEQFANIEQTLVGVPADIDGIFLLKVYSTSLIWYQFGFERGIPVTQDAPNTGAFLAYGPDLNAMGKQAARLADQVLRGTDIGDLPMEFGELYLTLDLGIAEALGIEISDSLLGLATNIINTDVAAEFEITTADSTNIIHSAGTGACAATSASPGGTNIVCVTTGCEDLPETGMITFSDKVDVGGCSAENLVGICSADAYDTYYYDGAAAALETGCGFMAGTWLQQPE